MNSSIHAFTVLIGALLVGCGGNVKTIESFQKSTDSLTNDYIVLASKIEAMCVETARATQMLSSDYKGPNTPRAQAAVDATCGGAEKEKKQLINAAVVLDSYTTALAEVAGLDVKVFDDDLVKLSGAISDLKDQQEKAVFNKPEVSAAESLAKFVAQELTAYRAKKEVVKALNENKDSYSLLVTAMSKHIGTVFPGQAHQHKAANDRLADALYGAGNAPGSTIGERLPARQAADIFGSRTATYKEATDAAEKFQKAASALIKASNDLAEKYVHLSKDEQLDSLISLVKRAKEVRDAVQAIN
jgi:hypothetical protein